jgi:hypothetical protein
LYVGEFFEKLYQGLQVVTSYSLICVVVMPESVAETHSTRRFNIQKVGLFAPRKLIDLKVD